jgi:hypothetical protein
MVSDTLDPILKESIDFIIAFGYDSDRDVKNVKF